MIDPSHFRIGLDGARSMRFQIDRASTWGQSKPCDDAVIGPTPVPEWLRQEWFIEIETLDQLLALAKANEGRIVVCLDDYSNQRKVAPFWKITIYDDYLE